MRGLAEVVTQSLGALDTVDPHRGLRNAVFANVDPSFALKWSPEDPRLLATAAGSTDRVLSHSGSARLLECRLGKSSQAARAASSDNAASACSRAISSSASRSSVKWWRTRHSSGSDLMQPAGAVEHHGG